MKNIVILPIEKKTGKEIVSNFSEIINLKNGDSGKILIFFDHEKLSDIIKMIFDKFYAEPIFVVIFTSEDINDIKKKIIIKLNKLSSIKKPFVDIDNFFIYKNDYANHKKILLLLLKVFTYYNQLDDGFFKDILDSDLKIPELDKELNYLNC